MAFPFVELEFTHGLGPPAGRYVVRAPGDRPAAAPAAAIGVVPTLPAGSTDVLVVRVEAASGARRPLLRRARAKSALPDEQPGDVPLYLVGLLFATREFADDRAAAAALAGWRAEPETTAPLVDEAVTVLNRAIRAYRAAAADPYVVEVTRADARAVRVGYGGQGLADGAWDDAVVLPPPVRSRGDRAARLRPTEVVADVLAGRRDVLEGEDVLLRAVLDLEAARPAAAARQLAVAVDLLVAADRGPGDRLADTPARARELCARLAGDGADTAAVAELSTLATTVGEAVDAWRGG